jgi:transposase-like protein
MDGLTGFPEAVRAVYPDTHVQLCIVHMVRNSTKFVSCKDLKKLCADLKAVYSAPPEQAGRDALEAFGKIWNAKYPMIYQGWDRHWPDLCEFFNYPPIDLYDQRGRIAELPTAEGNEEPLDFCER